MYRATREEIAELDRLAVASGLEIRQMMELAGWHMVSFFERVGIPEDASVCVVAGAGNKAGDGLAAARHLANNGREVSVVLINEEVKEGAAHHLNMAKAMGVRVQKSLPKADLYIDALIGYNLDGPPRGRFGEAVEELNASAKPVVSYDVPTGVDASTGECLEPCVNADFTLSLALLKKGYGPAWGRTLVADIGIPGFLYDEIAKGSRPDFQNGFAVVS